MSMGVMAALEGYVCEYEYDNKTFTFSYNETTSHVHSRQALHQEVDEEYVIFNTEGEPVAIKGNPIFEEEISNFGEYSFLYTGYSFYANWENAYISVGNSKCEINPDW